MVLLTWSRNKLLLKPSSLFSKILNVDDDGDNNNAVGVN